MIWESEFWKRDLAKRAAWLRQRLRRYSWGELALARFEQSIMMGFYSIRKLVEAKKLSNSTIDCAIRIRTYRSTGKLVTFRNWHKVDELYDFSKAKEVSRDIIFLCNQFVHSYVFIPLFTERNVLLSVIVSSDRERNSQAYEVSAKQIIELFENIASDFPNEGHFHFCPEKGDYNISSTMRK